MENLLKRNWFICSKGYDIKKDYILKKKDLLEWIKSIYDGKIISGYRDGLEIDIYENR